MAIFQGLNYVIQNVNVLHKKKKMSSTINEYNIPYINNYHQLLILTAIKIYFTFVGNVN